MTAINPPSFVQSGGQSALSDRLTIAALLGAGSTAASTRGGVRPTFGGQGLSVASTATPSAQVAVQAGTVHIPDGQGGAYTCHNDGTVNLTVAAASTTTSRIDMVVARVRDSSQGDASNAWQIELVQGTPSSGSPSPPSLPIRSWPLAFLTIVAGSTTAVRPQDITDARGLPAMAAGGVFPCTSATVPANPYPGMTIYLSDVDELRVYRADLGQWRRWTMLDIPDPIYTRLASTYNITGGSWGTITAALNVAITLPRPCWCDIRFRAVVAAESSTNTAGGSVQISHSATGATTWASDDNDVAWVFVSGTQKLRENAPISMAQPRLLAAGTTTILGKAQKIANADTGSVTNPVLGIVPLHWD